MPAPSLLLFVPGDWEAEPDGLRELRRHLSDEYGATLTVRPFRGHAPLPLCVGVWRQAPGEDVEDLILSAFFTLDWLEEVL